MTSWIALLTGRAKKDAVRMPQKKEIRAEGFGDNNAAALEKACGEPEQAKTCQCLGRLLAWELSWSGGFRKRGRRWRRQSDDCCAVTVIQHTRRRRFRSLHGVKNYNRCRRLRLGFAESVLKLLRNTRAGDKQVACKVMRARPTARSDRGDYYVVPPAAQIRGSKTFICIRPSF